MNPDDVKPQVCSLTIRSLIVGIISLITGFGMKYAVSDQQVTDITNAVTTIITFISMAVAWYGRVRATKMIGDPVTRTPTIPPKLFFGAVMLPALLLSGGCSTLFGANGKSTPPSPLQQVTTARQLYTTALNTLTPLMSNNVGIFGDQKVKDVLYDARTKVSSALDQAETYARNGSTADFSFWMQRVTDALNVLLDYQLKAQPGGATTKPAATYNDEQELPWESAKFSLALPPARNLSTALLQCSRKRIPEPNFRKLTSPLSSKDRSWRSSSSMLRPAIRA